MTIFRPMKTLSLLLVWVLQTFCKKYATEIWFSMHAYRFSRRFTESFTQPIESSIQIIYQWKFERKGNGAVYPCHNTIFQPNVMRSVIATAPTALVQQYKVCQYSMQAAVSQAIDIASGSAALYQGISIAIMLMVVIYTQPQFLQQKQKQNIFRCK